MHRSRLNALRVVFVLANQLIPAMGARFVAAELYGRDLNKLSNAKVYVFRMQRLRGSACMVTTTTTTTTMMELMIMMMMMMMMMMVTMTTMTTMMMMMM
jgi:hypothetical protein